MDSPHSSVTVIVPAYNAEKWLEECLDSVVGQTFRHWQCIIVDDGSTDTTGHIARRYALADSRFRVLTMPGNSGVSAARNAALDIADTPWILFLDADDTLHPEAISAMHLVVDDTNADMIVPQWHIGNMPTSLPPLEYRQFFDEISPDEAIRQMLLRKGIEASMSGRLLRRSLFENPALRFYKGRYEDLDLAYQVAHRANSVAVISETLYFYRHNPDSFIHTMSRARFDVLDVTDRMADFFAGTALADAAADRRFAAHFNILMLLYSRHYNDKDVEHRCLSVIKSLRTRTLRRRQARLKNRFGALASYGGRPLIKLLAKLFPQH